MTEFLRENATYTNNNVCEKNITKHYYLKIWFYVYVFSNLGWLSILFCFLPKIISFSFICFTSYLYFPPVLNICTNLSCLFSCFAISYHVYVPKLVNSWKLVWPTPWIVVYYGVLLFLLRFCLLVNGAHAKLQILLPHPISFLWSNEISLLE